MSGSLWTPNELYHYGIKGMKWEHHKYKPIAYTNQNGQKKFDVKEDYKLGNKPIVTKTTTYGEGGIGRLPKNPIEKFKYKTNAALDAANKGAEAAADLADYIGPAGLVGGAAVAYDKYQKTTSSSEKEKTKYELNRTNLRDISNQVLDSGKSKIYSLFGKKYSPKASGSSLSEVNNELARRSTPQGPKKKLNSGLRSTRTMR